MKSPKTLITKKNEQRLISQFKTNVQNMAISQFFTNQNYP